MKTAVILLNLGGPRDLREVRGFLFRLFADPAILDYPAPLRWPLAALIAAVRAKKATEIYRAIGGGSPLLQYTEEQAHALEKELNGAGATVAGPVARSAEASQQNIFRCFVSMRYAAPRAKQAVEAARAWGAEKYVLLPMYPQYSRTTTGSSFKDFERALEGVSGFLGGVVSKPRNPETKKLESYAALPGFINALAALIRPAYDAMALEAKAKNFPALRLLLSAHGLPQKFVDAGDPYAAQCAEGAAAVVRALNIPGLDWKLCYQSRVGPLAWLRPYTDDEILQAGMEKRPVLVAPLAFTAENSETLYEIDQLYRDLAAQSGVPLFARAACVNAHPWFIEGLAGLVRGAR